MPPRNENCLNSFFIPSSSCNLDPSKFESAARIAAAASLVRPLEPELDLAWCGSKRPRRDPEAMDRGRGILAAFSDSLTVMPWSYSGL